MAVPKQRQTSSRGKRRRSGHKKLQLKKLIKCSHCGKNIVSHRVCPYCGYYKNKKFITV